MIWFRIEAPHFVAAGEINKFGKVNHAAPIIKYMQQKQWTLNAVKHYCKNKNWNIEVFNDKDKITLTPVSDTVDFWD